MGGGDGGRGRGMPPIRCCSFFCGRRVFFGGADFFFAERLFFRNGEGGEWRASRVTVGVMAKDNGGACFPLDFNITHTIGRQPSPPHRGDFLFFSIHQKHTSQAHSAIIVPILWGWIWGGYLMWRRRCVWRERRHWGWARTACTQACTLAAHWSGSAT